MGYKAIRNCSKYKDRVIENNLADEFGEFVYDEMWNAVELIGEIHDKEVTKLETENKKLREALEFYADGNNWEEVTSRDWIFDKYMIFEDDSFIQGQGYKGGNLAREVLADLDEGK